MNIAKSKEKFVDLKKFFRSLSFPRGGSKFPAATLNGFMSKSKSTKANNSFMDEKRKAKCQVAPEGCFSVYVGAEKQRFVIKAEYANHPLFKMLLQDAELEYGFNSEGPILLPCDVDLFYKVMAEMDSGKEFHSSSSCGFAYGSCSPFYPTRRLRNSDMAKGYGSYGLLTPSRLMKMNPF